MKLMTFHEINDLENGQQIPALTGRIKKVFDQKQGEGDYGPWQLQSFILTDTHENEITCTWTGEDAFEPGQWEGKTITIESGMDKKDQLVGVKKEIRKKGDKTYESVRLDDRAKIKKDDQQGKPDPDWPEAPPTNKANGNGMDEARRHLMQSANLYCLVIDAVEKVIEPHFSRKITDELYQAAVGTLYIEASRAGYVSKIPAAPIKK